LSASAFSPNSSRRQPESAATAAALFHTAMPEIDQLLSRLLALMGYQGEIVMKRTFFGLALMSMAVLPAKAATLHESATFSDSSSGGYTLSTEQFLASRFTLSQSSTVTAIGGGIGGNGTLFGAIIPLSSPTETPSYLPYDLPSYALGFTVFNAPFGTADFTTPLSLSLNAGTYALVFGSGLFGATGSGFMGLTGVDFPIASYFFATINNGFNTFTNGGFSQTRFVVEGDLSTVPLPAALPLYATGLGIAGFVAWRRKRNKMMRAALAA